MRRFVLVVGVIVFTLVNISQVFAMTSKPIKVTIDGGNLNLDILPKLEHGRLLVPMRVIFEALNIQVEWDAATNTITGNNLLENSNIKLIIGQKTAHINDKAVELDVPAKIIEDRVLVPLRFVAEAVGKSIEWDEENNIVNIDSGFLQASLDEYHFWLKKSNVKLNELFIATDKSTPKKLADLDLAITDNDLMPTFIAEKTPQGNVLLTVKNEYGEPHVFCNVHAIYLNLASGNMHKANSHYSFRFEDNIKFHGEQVVLTDGKKVYLINDNTGTINKTFDCQELMEKENIGQEEENYFIEGIGENYLIIRPNNNGILTLINLKNNDKIQLYKELLGKEQQEYVETNDVPFKGDWLKFIGQKGNLLQFKNESAVFGLDTSVYTYPVPGKS